MGQRSGILEIVLYSQTPVRLESRFPAAPRCDLHKFSSWPWPSLPLQPRSTASMAVDCPTGCAFQKWSERDGLQACFVRFAMHLILLVRLYQRREPVVN